MERQKCLRPAITGRHSDEEISDFQKDIQNTCYEAIFVKDMKDAGTVLQMELKNKIKLE